MNSQRIDQIKEMLKQEPDDSFLNYALALEYAKNNELNEAITLLEALLKRDENYLGAYYQLSSYFQQTGQNQRAIDTYKTGIIIAQKQGNKKALGELNEALLNLEDDQA